MNELELTGRTRTHIVELDAARCALHYEAVAAFLAMKDAAALAGIELFACSSFRDFERQQRIWNQKWQGERVLLDREGRALDAHQLSDAERMEAILRWSAIPGGSRHHWGSDVDVADLKVMPSGYEVQLTPEEYAADGIFSRLSAWLDDNMSTYGFFRPYRNDRGGVAPEPWHLSYAPVALPAAESLSLALLRQCIQDSAMAGKTQVLARLPEIYTRFLLAIDPP